MTTILQAILNLEKTTNIEITAINSGNNRANNMGDALESYIKDMFAGTLSEISERDKMEVHSQKFSYIGNKTNPPDFMIRGGDAIEVKKIESLTAQLQLNSSHPKDKLHSDDPKITKHCRDCEDWTEKDMIYCVGMVDGKRLKQLWMVYGDCYAAERNIYTRIQNTISEGLEAIPNIELEETKELGRVNRIDPLGITSLRIRGMWLLDNPRSVFSYLDLVDDNALTTQINCIIPTEKYLSFPLEEREAIEASKRITKQDVRVKNPNNAALLINAIALTMNIESFL